MAKYDITEKASLNSSVVFAEASLVNLDSTHLALAYSGAGSDGFIQTIAIDGTYTPSVIHEIEHDATYGSYNALIKLDDTHLVLLYYNNSLGGYLKIFSIDGSYNLAEIKSQSLSPVASISNSIVRIDDTHFAICYNAANITDGIVDIYSVDGSYNMTKLKSLTFLSTSPIQTSIIKLDDTHLAIGYIEQSGYKPVIKTISFDGSYNMTVIDTETATPYSNGGGGSKVIYIDSSHIGLLYHNTATSAVRFTIFSIDGSFSNITEIDNIEVTAPVAQISDCVKIDNTTFLLAYTGTDSDGFIATIGTDASFNNMTVLNTLEHDTTLGEENNIALIKKGYYLLAYRGAGTTGWKTSFKIEGVDAGGFNATKLLTLN